MAKYHIEKHVTITWHVTAQREGDSLREAIAQCPSEGIALTIKSMYEKDEEEVIKKIEEGDKNG